MSVVKRLYISNTLMLVLPVVLVIITSICMLFIFKGTKVIEEGPPLSYGSIISTRMEVAQKLSDKIAPLTDIDKIQSSIDHFNEKNKQRGLTASLYAGQKRIIPEQQPDYRLPDVKASGSDRFIMVTDQQAFYQVDSGSYSLVLTDTEFSMDRQSESRQQLYAGIIMLIFLMFIVVGTNRALTRFVFRSIMTPIVVLGRGVHQLRDGNLTYRIEYDKQDEFAAVCADFNEMAQQLSDMVEERQKNENNRRELIAGISHDLRTPLTSIKAYLEGLEKGVANTPQRQAKYFNTIKSKTEHLEHIINQLFLFSTLDIGEFPLHLDDVEVGDELRKTVNSFKAEYEHEVSITYQNEFPQINAYIDVVQFRNVILNVLHNSRKYRNTECAEISVSCREQKQTLAIRLADNGPGVSPEELERLFDVFYRSDVSRRQPELGSGLGLAISRKVIERLGGRIYAELPSSGGLAMNIILPRVPFH